VSDGHVSHDELAELDEGVLAPARATEVEGHLLGCPECRARAASVRSVREQLAAVGSTSMPPDVADRVHVALAAAADDPAPAGASEVAPDGGTVVPHQARRPRRWSSPTFAAAAASFIVIAAIAAIVVGHSRHHNDSTATSAAGAGSAPSPFVQTAAPSAPAQITIRTTDRLYTPANLPSLAGTLTGGTRAFANRAASSSGAAAHDTGHVPAQLDRLYRSRQALLSCAAAITQQPNAAPLVVDFGRWTHAQYHAAPSAIFVFRQGSRGLAIVTGPTCKGLDEIRAEASVPLP
jgi:anti-sigma factor RsiW